MKRLEIHSKMLSFVLILTLTLGMLPLVGLLGAKEVNAVVEEPNSCNNVTAQVYVSVYATHAPNPVCYNTGTVLLGSEGNYTVTLHITPDYNPDLAVMAKVQNGVSQPVAPADVTESAIVFETLYATAGTELHFGALHYWMSSGVFYKPKTDFNFTILDEYYPWLYSVTTESQFDIYLSQMTAYSAVRIVSSTGTLLGESNLVNGRAFIPNISIEQGSRVYGLLLNNNQIEDSFFIGYQPPGMEYPSVRKTVAKGFDPSAMLSFETNQYGWYEPDENYVAERPANGILYYYATTDNFPILRLQNGNEERFITLSEHETIFSPSDLYTVTLTKALPESNVQLNGRIVYSKIPTEGNYYFDIPHLSDSQGRVTFVDFMPNKVTTIPSDIYYEEGMGLPFTLVPTSAVVPTQGWQANLPVVSVTRPGSPDPSKFELADLVWFAKNVYRFDIDQNGIHDGNDLTHLMHLLAPGYYN